MKMLKLVPYYTPEIISSTHLGRDLYASYEKAGICTELYTPTPTRGVTEEVRKEYKKRKYEEEFNGTLIVHRFSMFREGKNLVGRAIRYILCNLIQYYKGIHTDGVDVVFSSSTPPTQGLLCGTVAKTLSKKCGHKIPFIYNLQDVFPDSLVSSGITSKGSLVWKIGRRIEDRTYQYADKIIVISDDIKKNIAEKGVPENKIVVIPNWVDTNEVIPISREDNKLFDEFGIDRKAFTVVYAGNLGMAQGIDTFIDAAKQIDDVEFIIFGEGSSKEEYAERCRGYKNIHMFPLMPRNRVSEVYSMGDMCLVACKKGTGAGAVPSKTFSIMATGTPVLLSFDEGTALWDLIEKNECGICTHAGNYKELAEAINKVKQHEEKILEMGIRAKECVQTEFSKEKGTARIIDTILSEVNWERV